MAKQTSVQAAYHKPGDKSKTNASTFCGRCATLGLFIIVALFLMSLKKDTKAIEDELGGGEGSSGQGYHFSTGSNSTSSSSASYKVGDNGAAPVASREDNDDEYDDDDTDDSVDDNDDQQSNEGSMTGSSNGYGPSTGGYGSSTSGYGSSAGGGGSYGSSTGGGYGSTTGGSYGSGSSSSSYYSSPGLRGSDHAETEKDLSDTVDLASKDLEKAEEDEVKKEESMLTSTLKSMSGGIRSGLTYLLGGKESKEELDEIAKEVEDELSESIKKEFEEDADGIRQNAVYDLEMNVEREEDYVSDMKEIEDEVWSHEHKALDSVRSDIDESAERIKQRLDFRTAMVEKEILEKKLSEQLGYKVQLNIVDDHLDMASVQAAFQGTNGGYNNNPNVGGGMGNNYAPNNGQFNNGSAPKYNFVPNNGQGSYYNNRPPNDQGNYNPGYGNAPGGGASYGSGGGYQYQPPPNNNYSYQNTNSRGGGRHR